MTHDGASHSPPQLTEALLRYDPALKDAYRDGTLFPQLVQKYPGHLMFCARARSNRQVPYGRPLRKCWFFSEVLVGTRYLDAGYEVLWYYRQVEDEASYRMACELFGGPTAAQLIIPNSERYGQAPDLIVFDRRSKRFRFVECKRRGERFTPKQLQRFASIEQYLNHTLTRDLSLLTDTDRPSLFPPLAAGRWIHVARVEPQPPSPNEHPG